MLLADLVETHNVWRGLIDDARRRESLFLLQRSDLSTSSNNYSNLFAPNQTAASNSANNDRLADRTSGGHPSSASNKKRSHRDPRENSSGDTRSGNDKRHKYPKQYK
jgi:hypothetical protein